MNDLLHLDDIENKVWHINTENDDGACSVALRYRHLLPRTNGNMVCLTPDGEEIAIMTWSSSDLHIQVRNAISGKIMWTYAPEGLSGDWLSWITCCAFSPDGRALVVSTNRCQTLYIDVQKGVSLFEPITSTQTVHSIAFSDCDRLVASGRSEHGILIQTFSLFSPPVTIGVLCEGGQNCPVIFLHFSPQGLVSTNERGRINVWNVGEQRLVISTDVCVKGEERVEHFPSYLGLRYNEDRNVMLGAHLSAAPSPVVGATDRVLRLRIVCTNVQRSETVPMYLISPCLELSDIGCFIGGDVLVVQSSDDVTIFDLSTGKVMQKIENDNTSCSTSSCFSSAHVSKDGTEIFVLRRLRLATTPFDTVLLGFNLVHGVRRVSYLLPSSCESVLLSLDGACIISADRSGGTRIFFPNG